MRHFPQLAQATKRYRTMCFQRGMARYQAGSQQKDLFYYLVRPPSPSLPPFL